MNCKECLFRIDDRINNCAVCGLTLKYYPTQECQETDLYCRIIDCLKRRVYSHEITITYNTIDKK